MRRKGVFAARLVLCALILGIAMSASGCASCSRVSRSISSDWNGGVNRIVTVYSYTGEEISHWEGKLDYEYDEDRIMFDMDDGHRVSIFGGVVVVEDVES